MLQKQNFEKCFHTLISKVMSGYVHRVHRRVLKFLGHLKFDHVLVTVTVILRQLENLQRI